MERCRARGLVMPTFQMTLLIIMRIVVCLLHVGHREDVKNSFDTDQSAQRKVMTCLSACVMTVQFSWLEGKCIKTLPPFPMMNGSFKFLCSNFKWP